MNTPAIIISFNNHDFVDNTINQLVAYNFKNIIVIDNASNWSESQEYLLRLPHQVIRNQENFGHLCWARPEIFNRLPDKFFVTDPDLQFNKHLPMDFVEVMAEMSDRFKSRKIGFALDIADADQMFEYDDYHLGKSIWEWEQQFWTKPVPEESLDAFFADVDTTFHLYNKDGLVCNNIRLAGDYTAKHLPWYKKNTLISPNRMRKIYAQTTRVSTIAKFHIRQRTDGEALVSSTFPLKIAEINSGHENFDSFSSPKKNQNENGAIMLSPIVKDYKMIGEVVQTDRVFVDSSMATKEILKYIFTDNAPARTVLDIGFGIGELARISKNGDAIRHWSIDGVDGSLETCQNVELFRKKWYRNIWHGLAQDIAIDELKAYDVLCLFDVIEHLDAASAKQLLKSLLDSLGPDSRLVLSTPLWFYPQDQLAEGDLEEHLIGVPARSLLAMQPTMFLVSPAGLIGNFVFTRESLRHIDQFQPTTDRSFGLQEGLQHLMSLGLQADGKLYYTNGQTLIKPVKVISAPRLETMGQTPAHTAVNLDVLALIPSSARRIVEVGCMHGALAAAHREKQPEAHYVGIDIDVDYAAAAAANCSQTMAANIETMDDDAFAELFPSDCWIFADCLEHLRDPWRVLARVRQQIDANGSLLVCMPNAQHWSLQWRMASGQFRYEDSGLLDRTHLRWFTRITMLEMFEKTGWRVEQGLSRNLNAPQQPKMLDAIRSFAVATGLDPDVAAQDATAFQYVFKLVPAA